MGEQGLHGAEEALLSGSQQVLHAPLHMMVARVEDGLQEGQHLSNNLIVWVGQQWHHLQGPGGSPSTNGVRLKAPSYLLLPQRCQSTGWNSELGGA